MKISELVNRPIPNLNNVTARDYHLTPIEFNHPLNNEPLVKVSEYNIASESYYGRKDGFNSPYYSSIQSSLANVWCRQSVAERLCTINNLLKKEGIELFLLDGYRPIGCQQALWDFTMNIARKILTDPTEKNCRDFVGRYWSDPTRFNKNDSTTWPTHATGGAVDLTLRRICTGEHLFMGGTFDDPSELSHTSFYENINGPDQISYKEASKNRRILFWSMIEAGFSNYSYEWWHYDLGNQMWSMNRGLLQGDTNKCLAYYGLGVETDEILSDKVI